MKKEEIPMVVTAENLTKVFKDFWMRPKVLAVDNLDLGIRRGEVFGLLGPNGSGKSTTIKILLGLLHPTRGAVSVLGHTPRHVNIKERIGYLPEESYLYPYLTSEETLHFYGRLFNLSGPERTKRVSELLSMIGLEHTRHRVVGEFSKGMARRIGLAQALINDPDVVILDEPTSGLDPIGCRQVKDLILALARRGKTIILSSHLLADVEDVCSRIAILYNGRIQATGSIHELLEERDQVRFSVNELSPEEIKDVLRRLREILQRDVSVDHPRKNLEQYFIEVIERAQLSSREDSGSRSQQALAPFLSTRNEAKL